MLRQPGMLTDTLAKGQRPDEQVLDDVYRTFAPSDPFLPVHNFVDHATMGAEALVGLGLGREVEGWVRRHRVRAYTPPRTGISIQAAWKEALGRRECHGDWLSFFEAEVRYAQAGAAAFVEEPTIGNLHLVTGPMAYLLIFDRLDPAVHPAAAAAFDRTHVTALSGLARLEASARSEPVPVVDCKLLGILPRQDDAHPIKLTEAALRAYEATHDEIFIRAIGRVRHLHGARALLGIARGLLRREA